jgi:hypothetical protein
MVTRKIDATGYMAVYMQANCQDKIEELIKNATKLIFLWLLDCLYMICQRNDSLV